VILDARLFVGRQVEHLLEFGTVHEDVSVQEWIAAYVAREPEWPIVSLNDSDFFGLIFIVGFLNVLGFFQATKISFIYTNQ